MKCVKRDLHLVEGNLRIFLGQKSAAKMPFMSSADAFLKILLKRFFLLTPPTRLFNRLNGDRAQNTVITQIGCKSFINGLKQKLTFIAMITPNSHSLLMEVEQ